ncbi:MAG: methyltransferase [Bacteroidetes bacterium]|nr:methyltransferase [Bacteroidota bacterium]MBS1686455.1 methyltransferase [Bacteroidota bacterium]
MSQPFRFKQFSVAHDKCAMKVNTDGVLLGAWADVADAQRILDIGTGTGVIALMLAQRSRCVIVTAIDIDKDAAEQAQENALASPWADRLCIRHTSLQDMPQESKFDLIVSNPPYFINDYISEDTKRNVARHSTTLPYSDLLTGLAGLLSSDGRACLILPYFNVGQFLIGASEKGLHLSRRTDVVAVEGREPYVTMLTLVRVSTPVLRDSLVIQNRSGAYTDEYRHLTQHFYLKF